MAEPEVTRVGVFDMQVCVPAEYTDEQAETFANADHPAGTTRGWRMRAADDPAQNGAPIRVKCTQHSENVHIMLSC